MWDEEANRSVSIAGTTARCGLLLLMSCLSASVFMTMSTAKMSEGIKMLPKVYTPVHQKNHVLGPFHIRNLFRHKNFEIALSKLSTITLEIIF